MKIFDLDSPLMNVLNKMADLITLTMQMQLLKNTLKSVKTLKLCLLT